MSWFGILITTVARPLNFRIVGTPATNLSGPSIIWFQLREAIAARRNHRAIQGATDHNRKAIGELPLSMDSIYDLLGLNLGANFNIGDCLAGILSTKSYLSFQQQVVLFDFLKVLG